MAAAVIVTVITGVDYVARALRLRRTSPRAAMKRARRAEQQAAKQRAAEQAEQERVARES
jgi:CDP-diacylglycerol--glycerol-3-phosphate 3-phosphatidyltransferase